jgi:hypothetical protein
VTVVKRKTFRSNALNVAYSEAHRSLSDCYLGIH